MQETKSTNDSHKVQITGGCSKFLAIASCTLGGSAKRCFCSDYGVSFPDLPGVITAGSNLDEARTMATEALAFHLEGLAEDSEAVPEPSSLKEIMAIAENLDSVAVLIEAPVAEVKSVRVNMTFT